MHDSSFICERCNKKFTTLGHLTRHEKAHDGNASNPCPHCPKSFNRSDVLARHIQVLHQGVAGAQDASKKRKRSCEVSAAKRRSVSADIGPSIDVPTLQHSIFGGVPQASGLPSSTPYDPLPGATFSPELPSSFITGSSALHTGHVAVSPFRAPTTQPHSASFYTEPSYSFSAERASAALQSMPPFDFSFSAQPYESIREDAAASFDNSLGWGFSDVELDLLATIGATSSLTTQNASPTADWLLSLGNNFHTPGSQPTPPGGTLDDSTNRSVDTKPARVRTTAAEGENADSPWPHIYRPAAKLHPLALPDVSSATHPLSHDADQIDISASYPEIMAVVARTHKPAWSTVSSSSFPSEHTISTCVNLYFQRFHDSFPILSKSKIKEKGAEPVLLLAIAAIGATLSRDGLEGLGVALSELVRRALQYLRESDPRMEISSLLNLQALFSVSEIQAVFPDSIERWSAPNSASWSNMPAPDRVTFFDTLESLLNVGALQQPLNDFSTSIMAFTLYRLCVDAACLDSILSSAEPTSGLSTAFASNVENNPQLLLDSLSTSIATSARTPTSLLFSAVALAHHSYLQFTLSGFLDEAKLAGGRAGAEKKAIARRWLRERMVEEKVSMRRILAHAALLNQILTRHCFDTPAEVTWQFEVALALYSLVKFGGSTILSGENPLSQRTEIKASDPALEVWIQRGGPVALKGGLSDFGSLTPLRLLEVMSDQLESSPWGLSRKMRGILTHLQTEEEEEASSAILGALLPDTRGEYSLRRRGARRQRGCASKRYKDKLATVCLTTVPSAGCVSGYYLNSANNCVKTCSSGYFANTSHDSSVKTCTGANGGSALTCATGYYLNSARNCVKTCSAGYFANSSHDSAVKTCTGDTGGAALSCFSGYYLTTTKNCVSSCPSGYTVNSAKTTCVKAATTTITTTTALGPQKTLLVNMSTFPIPVLYSSATTLACTAPPTTFEGTATGFATVCSVRYCDAAGANNMKLSSTTGAVTRSEIESALGMFAAIEPVTSNGQGNVLSFGVLGQAAENVGLLFEATGDIRALDLALKYADNILTLRNDPTTGRVMWTGVRELVWPTSPTIPYAGSENGDIVGHMVQAAVYILKAPCLWGMVPKAVDSSWPTSFASNATYLTRALRLVEAGDETVESYFLPYWFDSNLLAIQPNDSRYSVCQDTLLHGFFALAAAHETVPALDTVRTWKYDRYITANLKDFVANLEDGQNTSSGATSFTWNYVKLKDDTEQSRGVHGYYDVLGMWWAYQRSKSAYGVTDAIGLRLAHTMNEVINLGNSKFGGRNFSGRFGFGTWTLGNLDSLCLLGAGLV
ncbi:hypothetical protein MNV49_007944 [Pseudohyphozyma bogoriensis]|nr:hypothetical protein MNV49_007944 [Pseudohyphozyma bogoriensis]